MAKRKSETEDPMPAYRPAPSVAQIANELIRDYHEHLINTRIEYVFLDKTPTSKGKEVWGRARKMSGLAA